MSNRDERRARPLSSEATNFGCRVNVGSFEPQEARAQLEHVVAEVHDAFARPQFAVVRRERTIAQMYAAAALAHCCQLARTVVRLHADGDEIAGRMVARGLFESWAVGAYVHFGGFEALTSLGDDFHFELKVQADEATRHDEALRRKRADIDGRNRRIEHDNVAKARWNRANPDQPAKKLVELLPPPPGVLIDSDWSERAKYLDGSTPRKLPLKTMIDKLRTFTRRAGAEQTFEAAYAIMFRGLSTVGAHTNIRVLDWYLDDDDGRATFVRVGRQPSPPSSLEDANVLSALLLVAHLAQLVLESRGCDHAVADEVMNRFSATAEVAGSA